MLQSINLFIILFRMSPQVPEDPVEQEYYEAVRKFITRCKAREERDREQLEFTRISFRWENAPASPSEEETLGTVLSICDRPDLIELAKNYTKIDDGDPNRPLFNYFFIAKDEYSNSLENEYGPQVMLMPGESYYLRSI